QQCALHWHAASVGRNFSFLLRAVPDVRFVSPLTVITSDRLRPSTHKRSLTYITPAGSFSFMKLGQNVLLSERSPIQAATSFRGGLQSVKLAGRLIDVLPLTLLTQRYLK